MVVFRRWLCLTFRQIENSHRTQQWVKIASIRWWMFLWSSWSVLFLEKCTLMMGVRIEKANELLNPLRYVFEDYRSGKESDGFVSWTVLMTMTMTMNDQADAGDGHVATGRKKK